MKKIPYWKPSKAQMIALSLAIDGRCPPTSYYFGDLKDLYEELDNICKAECKLKEKKDEYYEKDTI